MSKISLISTLLAISFMFGACSNETKNKESANSMLSTNEYVLKTLDRKDLILTKGAEGFTLKGAENKIIILDIFATWCPPCQAEAAHLASLQKKYKDSILVVGITVEKGMRKPKLLDFRETYGADYTLVNSKENSRLIGAVANQLKVGSNFGIPLLALYKNGKIIKFYQGAVEEEFLESDIKQALGK